jgi:hypothetical protein
VFCTIKIRIGEERGRRSGGGEQKYKQKKMRQAASEFPQKGLSFGRNGKSAQGK